MVVLAVGEPQDWSGEAQSRTLIVLPPAQQAHAEAELFTTCWEKEVPTSTVKCSSRDIPSEELRQPL